MVVTYPGLINNYSTPLNGGGNIYWIDFEKLMQSFY